MAEPLTGERLAGAFASAFALTLTNPITILAFTAIFAKVGHRSRRRAIGGIAVLVGGVFAGSACWWLGISTRCDVGCGGARKRAACALDQPHLGRDPAAVGAGAARRRQHRPRSRAALRRADWRPVGALAKVPPMLLPGFRRLVALMVCALLALAAPARAQSAAAPPATPPPISADELKKLVDTLNDPAQRQHLVAQLQALIAAQNAQAQPAQAPTVFEELSSEIDTITGEILSASQVLVDAPRLAQWVESQVENPAARDFWLAVAVKLALIFGVALVADRAAWLLLRGAQRKLAAIQSASLPARVLLILLAMIVEALPAVAFAAAALFAVPFTQPSFGTREVAQTLIDAILTARIVLAAARIALLSRAAEALYPLGGETRQYLYIWTRRFTGWAGLWLRRGRGGVVAGRAGRDLRADRCAAPSWCWPSSPSSSCCRTGAPSPIGCAARLVTAAGACCAIASPIPGTCLPSSTCWARSASSRRASAAAISSCCAPRRRRSWCCSPRRSPCASSSG